MEGVTIRKVSIDDLENLQKIGRQTFYETFSPYNSEENMGKYMEEGFSREKLLAECNNPYSEFYLAEQEGKVIGYVKLNRGPSQTELKDDRGVEIERIYVLKEYHGKKLGQLLYDKAIERTRQLNAEYVWLGVWTENQRAISFYKKNGFIEFDKHIFKLGDDEQIDLMMKLELK